MSDKRNLPAEVLARLTERGINLADVNAETSRRGRTVESRVFTRPEIRMEMAEEDPDPIFEGYATIYDYPYDIAGGPEAGGWTEIIAPGACAKSAGEADVRLLVNHEDLPLARTKSGTLVLTSDDIGLKCYSKLDGDNPTVTEVRSCMERGDVDEMSFAFQVLRQTWSPDYYTRTITEVKLFDVSIGTYPANPAATAILTPTTDDIDVVRSGYPLSLALAEIERLALVRS